MKNQMSATVLSVTLALSSIFGWASSKVQALPPVDNTVDDTNSSGMPDVELSEEAYTGTKFSCVSQGDGSVATVGQRPGGQPIPVIIWTSGASRYFGEKYTPQSRCQIVTPKFNQAVAESGGSLKDVVLMTGRVKDKTVICVVSSNDTGCHGGNTLFTLKPENAKKADAILAQIMRISREGSSAGSVYETQGRVQFNLNDVLNQNAHPSLQQSRKKPIVRNHSSGL
ncbi:COP23 domain-containing protein [Sphaerospermopsis torques-reginae]|uniref:COP23 domain-containing protein n=1 Tax=Sphaerospermopsis torques-reginae ITEP-024 TaxID=984208 RepID=A0ABX8X298_9CYAN|nr:COP23 domain-containing protein [Sphaerospermopsis torques-reginae]QYX32811.1 COP23 domain-containing protein [Sphaerospermopsis torques-reginae ITEP-024]